MDNYKFTIQLLPPQITNRFTWLARRISAIGPIILTYIAVTLPGPNPCLGIVALVSMLQTMGALQAAKIATEAAPE